MRFLLVFITFFLASTSLAEKPEVTYVGSTNCTSCHKKEHGDWSGSHHDLAMQKVSKESVLGNFNNSTFTYNGITSKFYTEGRKYIVQTDGPDGKLTNYPIKYVFGFYPLQQYLIDLGKGKIQALSISWDSRPKQEGGQRWFHLYPDEKVDHKDSLHWTRVSQNWNYMCAECHSTNLKKNFDVDTKSYNTTWNEINVSCEACHGPGSKHVKWAKDGASAKNPNGLVVSLKGNKGIWKFTKNSSTAVRSEPLEDHSQIETCARCHSRRGVISEDYRHGESILNTHRVSNLTEGLYHSDGQIDDEVYVYGSFLQSKMYSAGVSCTDCHNAHSLRLKASDNSLCAQCHKANVYDTKKHHFHKADSEGAKCINCHMPSKYYMVVDKRRDHSFRIPRPDLTEKLKSKDACTDCHSDKPPSWAANQIKEWYGHEPVSHYGEAIHKGRLGESDSTFELVKLVRDTEQPGIVRATAVELLAANQSFAAQGAIEMAAKDSDPLLRKAAAESIQFNPEFDSEILLKLLSDPIRAVRIEAASAATYLPPEALTDSKEFFAKALEEYRESLLLNADYPTTLTAMARLSELTTSPENAISWYKRAIEIEPHSVQAYVNLSDLLHRTGKDKVGEKVLLEGLVAVPNSGALHHAYGLNLVRQKETKRAAYELKKAAELEPQNPRFQYVYAVSLDSEGKSEEAVAFVKNSLKLNPNSIELLNFLLGKSLNKGDVKASRRYAERLYELDPESEALKVLLDTLPKN